MRSRLGLLSFVLVTGALVIPHLAHAAIPFFGPIIQDWGSANGSAQTCPLGWGAVVNVINNVISFAITMAIVAVAPIMISYAGFLMVVEPVSSGGRAKAKSILTNTIVGIVIALAAWLIVDAVMAVLYNPTEAGGTWSSLVTSGGVDPCLHVATSFNQAEYTGNTVGGGECPGSLVCTNGKCQTDPQLDNGTGAAGQPCKSSAPNCTSGLVCDNTGICSSSATSATPIPSSCGVTTTTGQYNAQAAASYALSHAQSSSTHQCALYVRLALAAGGLTQFNTNHPADAKDYGSYLTGAGFQLIDSGNINSPHMGDVVVFQPVPGGSTAGHIEIFAGSNWVSDFIQQTPWPYATHGAYSVYRFPGT